MLKNDFLDIPITYGMLQETTYNANNKSKPFTWNCVDNKNKKKKYNIV